MKNTARRIAIFFLLFISVSVIATTAITGLFEDRIGRQIVKEVNKSLKTELQIKEVDLSLLRAFPNAAVNLKEILLKDTNDKPLLTAQNLSFRFKLFSLFSEKIKVMNALVENGVLAIRYDKRGKPNYDVFVYDESATEQESQIAILLQEARLSAIQLIYEDATQQQQVQMQVEEAVFAGDFSADAFSLISKANLISDSITYQEQKFLPNKRISYDAKIAVNLKEGNYTVDRATITVEGNPFSLDGSVVTTNQYTDYDLIIKKNSGNLENVLQLLPEQYLAQLGDFSSKGEFYFNAFINGRSAKNLVPEIDVEFGLDKGQLNSPRLADSFRDVSFDARYNNGAKLRTRKSIFEISKFKGYFDRELIELQLRVDDLSNPMIDFNLDGAIPLKAVYGLFNNPNIKAGIGEIEVENLVLKGKYSDMQSPSTISRVSINGIARFDDAGLTINGEKMLFDKGELVLEGNNLWVKEVKIQGADSEILLNGEFTNLIPVLLADSLNTQQVELIFDATLNAPMMDLDRLIGLTTPPVEEKKLTEEVVDSLQTKAIQQRESFTKFLKGKFAADVKAFNYGKISGQNFKGALQFDNNKMTIKGNTNAMKGKFALDGEMYFEGKRYLKARIICQDIDGKQFFYESDNFGQDILTDKHIKGTLTSKISIDAYWDDNLNFDYDKLRVLSELNIKDGELNDFELFKSFSTYIKMRDLEQVRFTDLTNWLEVRNSKIYIPVMFIQSNALNLILNGMYSFDYDFDFNMQINAGQVMANKIKRHDPNLTPLPSKKKGWFNLYYKMYGKNEDYKYESARREVLSDFEKSEHQKQRIRATLKREFGNLDFINAINWEDDTKLQEASDEE